MARHDIVFDEIHAYEPHITEDEFVKTLPRDWSSKVSFLQVEIASSREDASWTSPFVPASIRAKTVSSDYVLVKLDTGSPEVEASNLRAILADKDSYNIDEIVWDHRSGGHYNEWVDMFPGLALQEVTIYCFSCVSRASALIRGYRGNWLGCNY